MLKASAAVLLVALVLPFHLLSQTASTLTGNSTSGCSTANNMNANCSAAFNAMADAGQTFNAAPVNVSKVNIHSIVYGNTASDTTKYITPIYVHFQPWFQMPDDNPACDGITGQKTHTCNGHVQVGYSSNKDASVAAQINDMISRGFNGIVVDWYGQQKTVEDQTTQKIAATLSNGCPPGIFCSFTFALTEDQGSFLNCKTDPNPTSCVVGKIEADLQYINSKYFSSTAYLRVNNRPVLLFFVDDSSTGPFGSLVLWQTVWNAISSYAPSQGNPLLLFENIAGFSNTRGFATPHPASSGGYAWVNCNGGLGNCAAADPYGLNYLTSTQGGFYWVATANVPAQQAWGAAWKGFDNTQAGFPETQGVIGQDCGHTWIKTMRAMSVNGDGTSNLFFGDAKPLPVLQVVTWNDYDEGTEIETGIDNCLTISASLAGKNLNWTLSNETNGDTIDHFDIYKTNTTGGFDSQVRTFL